MINFYRRAVVLNHNKTCVNWHVLVAGCHYMPVFVSLMQKDNYHIVW